MNLNILTIGLIIYIMFLIPLGVMLDGEKKMQDLLDQNQKAQAVLIQNTSNQQKVLKVLTGAAEIQRALVEGIKQSTIRNESLTIKNGDERRMQMEQVVTILSQNSVERKSEFISIMKEILLRTSARVTRTELNAWSRKLQAEFPANHIPEMPHIDAPPDVTEKEQAIWHPPVYPVK